MLKVFIYLIFLIVTNANVYSQKFKIEVKDYRLFNDLREDIIPVISENNDKSFFIRNFNLETGAYGGLLSKNKYWFDKKILDRFSDECYEKYLSNNVIGINQTNQIMYLINNKLTVKKRNKFKGFFYSIKYNNAWSDPQILKFGGKKIKKIHSFYINKTCNFLIVSMKSKRNNFGSYDLYISILQEDNRWSEFINLGPSINTEKAEVTPFFYEKNKVLFFSTEKNKGEGNMNVVYTTRLYNSWKVWTYPIILKNKVNEDDELFFNLINDSLGIAMKKNGYNMSNIFKYEMENTNENNISVGKSLTNIELENILKIPAKNCIISFTTNSTYLDMDSKELLWFIVNKIKSEPDVKIRLLYKSYTANIDDLYKKRTFEICQYLQSLGINTESILISKVGENVNDNDILIRLYK